MNINIVPAVLATFVVEEAEVAIQGPVEGKDYEGFQNSRYHKSTKGEKAEDEENKMEDMMMEPERMAAESGETRNVLALPRKA